MNGDVARRLSFSLICVLEECLAEHEIMIPSRDREGEPDEACIYGTEYYLLEDQLASILKWWRLPIEKRDAGKLVWRIIEVFEEMLDYHRVLVVRPRANRRGDAPLCEEDRDRLVEELSAVLERARTENGALMVKQ